MTKKRSEYIQKCSQSELRVRKEIIEARIGISRAKICLNYLLNSNNFDGCILSDRAYFLDQIEIRKLRIAALKKLLPDIKVRRSDGVLIIEDIMWKNFFKKYFDKCKNEDEILEMNVEICNAVKAAAKARMDKLYKKSL